MAFRWIAMRAVLLLASLALGACTPGGGTPTALGVIAPTPVSIPAAELQSTMMTTRTLDGDRDPLENTNWTFRINDGMEVSTRFSHYVYAQERRRSHFQYRRNRSLLWRGEDASDFVRPNRRIYRSILDWDNLINVHSFKSFYAAGNFGFQGTGMEITKMTATTSWQAALSNGFDLGVQGNES